MLAKRKLQAFGWHTYGIQYYVFCPKLPKLIQLKLLAQHHCLVLLEPFLMMQEGKGRVLDVSIVIWYSGTHGTQGQHKLRGSPNLGICNNF